MYIYIYIYIYLSYLSLVVQERLLRLRALRGQVTAFACCSSALDLVTLQHFVLMETGWSPQEGRP